MADAGRALERPDPYVVARFLERLDHDDGLEPPAPSKGKLQLATRLNYDLFRRYLAFLVQRGLVVERPGPHGATEVRITTAGRESHRRFREWAAALLGRAPF